MGSGDSILFIREAQRADSGHYQLRVQLSGLEATATIDTLVIGTVGGMGDDVVLGGSHPSLKRNQHREPGKRGCGTQWWVKGGVAEQKRRGPSWSDVLACEACHARCHAWPFQRSQALLRVSSWWMSGAPALPWSGLRPKTREHTPGVHGAEG